VRGCSPSPFRRPPARANPPRRAMTSRAGRRPSAWRNGWA